MFHRGAWNSSRKRKLRRFRKKPVHSDGVEISETTNVEDVTSSPDIKVVESTSSSPTATEIVDAPSVSFDATVAVSLNSPSSPAAAVGCDNDGDDNDEYAYPYDSDDDYPSFVARLSDDPVSTLSNGADSGHEDNSLPLPIYVGPVLKSDNVLNEIKASGFIQYLTSTCAKSARRVNTIMTRVNWTLSHMVQLLGNEGTYFSSFSAAIQDVISTHHYLLEPCGVYLKCSRHLSPGTVCDYLMDCHIFFTWWVLFSPDNKKLAHTDLMHMTHRSTILQKLYRKQEKEHLCHITMESKVANRVLPEGNFDDQWNTLQTTSHNCLKKLVGTALPLAISLQYFNWVLGLVVACLYVFSPQGRIHGIATLLLSQVTSFLF